MIRLHSMSMYWLKQLRIVDFRVSAEPGSMKAVLGEEELEVDDRVPRNELLEKTCELLVSHGVKDRYTESELREMNDE